MRMGMIIHDNATGPLQYWKVNEKKFPTLSRAARKYLSVPASSAPIWMGCHF